MSLVQRVVTAPVAALRAGDRTLRRAVENALSAAVTIGTHNDERYALTPAWAAEAQAVEPGMIERLSREECLRLLASKHVGRYAYVANASSLDVVPVNYLMQSDGSIAFCSGPGSKLSSADRGEIVGFEVDDIDEDARTGWSVHVVGRARRLSPTESDAMTERPQPWAKGPRHHVVVVTPTRIDGRRLV